MVDVETAVKIAFTQLGKVMPEYLELNPAVEEFERSKDGSLWNVTFRAKNPDLENGTKHIFYPYRDKVVQIQTSDGDLIAIKNPTYE
jgi:hypothetical protein